MLCKYKGQIHRNRLVLILYFLQCSFRPPYWKLLCKEPGAKPCCAGLVTKFKMAGISRKSALTDGSEIVE